MPTGENFQVFMEDWRRIRESRKWPQHISTDFKKDLEGHGRLDDIDLASSKDSFAYQSLQARYNNELLAFPYVLCGAMLGIAIAWNTWSSDYPKGLLPPRSAAILRGFLRQNFIQRLPPARPAAYTLLTAAFSHQKVLHFCSTVLPAVYLMRSSEYYLEREQRLAFYFSAAAVSALAGHLGNLWSKPGALVMGASGATWALFGLHTWINGHRQICLPQIPGLPELRFSHEEIFWAAVVVQLARLLPRPLSMNRWAHLGGALFGIMYIPVISKRYWPTAEDDIDRARKLHKEYLGFESIF